ncbi:MAG: glycosyltransferase family 2 protein [Lachnospiraceae bacterium]|nr:glycosyltransferase family 2 protein [Lachnospiraceae bacterium]
MISVSVIIPTYGNPKYLKKSIDSVLTQTLNGLELIVVDDNQPESSARKQTEKIIGEYRGRVQYIQHDCNKNGAAARNTGIRAAKGRYIAFLDSDDEYEATRLEKCFSALEKNADKYGAVYTGCSFYRNDTLYRKYSSISSGNFLVETLACEFAFCTGSNIFMKASIVQELNGFDETFLRHQDYEFLVRFFEKYSILAFPEILVRKNDEYLNLPKVGKVIEIKKQYLNKYKYLIDELSNKQINYIYSSQYYQISQLAIESGNKAIFKQYSRLYRTKNGFDIKKEIRLFVIYLKKSIGRI